MKYSFMSEKKNHQIEKNDIVTITIEDISNNGEGIGKYNGYTLFVKDTVVGDVAEVKVIKAKKTYGYGKLLSLVSPQDSVAVVRFRKCLMRVSFVLRKSW